MVTIIQEMLLKKNTKKDSV